MGDGRCDVACDTIRRSSLFSTALLWLHPDPTVSLALGVYGLDAFVAYVVCSEALARITVDDEPVLSAPRGVLEAACLVCPPAAMALTLIMTLLGLAWQSGWFLDLWDDDDDGDA